MRPAPCKDCERKGCGSYHDKCLDYLQWKKEKAEDNQKDCKKRKWRRLND